jgi:hypothetical protein
MATADALLSAVPRSSSSGIRTMARLGFATIGVVYILMGILSLLAAAGQRDGDRASKEEAVQHLQDVPGGPVLLGLIAFGLLGYILWRFAQAVRDTEQKGTGAKGLAIRAWYVISGLFYSGLALYAGRLAWRGQAEQSGSETSRALTARVLSWPGGHWLILLTGLVIVGIAIYQVYRAYSGQSVNDMNARRLPRGQQRLVLRMGQVGYTARAVVIGLIGYFFVQAGQHSQAADVGNTSEAFDLLAAMGPAALGTVAAGLVAYGLFMLVQARYPVLHGL